MSLSQLFRRYSTFNDVPSASYMSTDENSIADTLLEELESQCRHCSTFASLQNKRNSHIVNSPADGMLLASSVQASKRHASVDYSWLSPKSTPLPSTQEIYQLSDIIKMELSELIGSVLPEDCTLIINQFRRHVRAQAKLTTPENIIALFRKTIAEFIDQKQINRAHANPPASQPTGKGNPKSSSTIGTFSRNNRINPKYQSDDERHCIAELTEISVTSSSNDATENKSSLHVRQ